MPKLNAVIDNQKQIAKDTYEITFALNTPKFTFKPGQYIWVVIPKLSYPDSKGERRAFSITSDINSPSKISVIFRKGMSGYKKTLLSLAKDAQLMIDGPYGSSFDVEQNAGSKLVMIAGGVGIAPFIGIIRSHSNLTKISPVSLINFNSNEEKAFLVDEMRNTCKQNNIIFVNKYGHADLGKAVMIPQFKTSKFFICGPQAMVDAIYTQLIRLGVTDEQMIFEEVYPNIYKSISV